MARLCVLFLIELVGISLSLKIGSYNTFQIVINPLAGALLSDQVEQVGSSDLDVICLQELFSIPSTQTYLDALKQYGFTNSFSIIDIYSQTSPNNLLTPRTPCKDNEFLDALSSECSIINCSPFYDASLAYGECLATLCPNEYNKLIYSECAACIGVFPLIQPQLSPLFGSTLNDGILFCSNPPTIPTDPPIVFGNNLFNLTDGTVIVSRQEYPIINTWSFILPSDLFIEKRLNMAQINICSETQAQTQEYGRICTDSIIVGCVHLEPTGYVSDTNVPQSPRLEDDSITSHVGLNRFQTEYILDNVYNEDILTTLGINDNDDIYGVFLMGDTNSGQLFNPCQFDNDGFVIPDNCNDGNSPSNTFDLFKQNGLIDGPDIKYFGNYLVDVECTSCLDENDKDDFNILAVDPSNTFINDAEASRDLDHIFIQNGYCKRFKSMKFSREFNDKIVDGVVDGQLVPTSDHYGVSLDMQFADGWLPPAYTRNGDCV